MAKMKRRTTKDQSELPKSSFIDVKFVVQENEKVMCLYQHIIKRFVTNAVKISKAASGKTISKKTIEMNLYNWRYEIENVKVQNYTTEGLLFQLLHINYR